jgi:hypothetical protein
MACQNLFKEAVDLGITIAFRFYGRYPETGRSYYKPPCCNVAGNETDDGENRPAERRIISSRRRPSLMQSLQLPNNFSVWWLPNLESATASGVVSSPSPQNVGAHWILHRINFFLSRGHIKLAAELQITTWIRFKRTWENFELPNPKWQPNSFQEDMRIMSLPNLQWLFQDWDIEVAKPLTSLNLFQY